jgi:hypothetical protein
MTEEAVQMTTTTTLRPLHEIASEIKQDPAYKSAAWCADPYVDALLTMDDATQPYYADSGESVVLYALSNLQSYRGETARRVKVELKEHAARARKADRR